jgi:hypothetical protein
MKGLAVTRKAVMGRNSIYMRGQIKKEHERHKTHKKVGNIPSASCVPLPSLTAFDGKLPGV